MFVFYQYCREKGTPQNDAEFEKFKKQVEELESKNKFEKLQRLHAQEGTTIKIIITMQHSLS